MTTETVATDTAGAGAPPRTRPRIRLRPLILGIVGLIVIALVARFGYNYYIDSTLYVTTDDALIDSNMVSVAPLASGTLAIWRIKPGDRVRAGQPLVQIDPDRQQAATTVIESQRAARESDLEFARQELARIRQLQKDGIVSRSDLVRQIAMRWVCPTCGEVVRGPDAPEQCPSCHTPKSAFTEQAMMPGM